MKFLWFLLLILFISCSVKNKVETEPINKKSENLVREFKMVFLKECIRKGSQNKCYDCLSRDISTSSDFILGLKNYKLIDSLVGKINHNIYIDSLERINRFCNGCDEDTLQRKIDSGTIGRQTFGFCLDYYTSNELDSIARTSILSKNKW